MGTRPRARGDIQASWLCSTSRGTHCCTLFRPASCTPTRQLLSAPLPPCHRPPCRPRDRDNGDNGAQWWRRAVLVGQRTSTFRCRSRPERRSQTGRMTALPRVQEPHDKLRHARCVGRNFALRFIRVQQRRRGRCHQPDASPTLDDTTMKGMTKTKATKAQKKGHVLHLGLSA